MAARAAGAQVRKLRRARRLVWAFVAILGVGLLAAGPAGGASSREHVVYQVAITGGVDSSVARALDRAIHEAQDARAAAVVVRLDTPGGLLTSMQDIVKSIEAARVPVVCWVGPPGAFAASAGTFILMGCPVAAMAPGTNTGAAHPITSSGGTVSEKVTNHYAAYIRGLAEQHHRNADWAERAVRKAVSITATRAVAIHVVDLIANDVPSLLHAVNGQTVDGGAGPVTFHVGNPSLHEVDLSPGESIVHWLSDADLGFLLFIFGLFGLIFEVVHPGLNVPGIVGIILIVLAFLVFDTLPISWGGLALIVVAFVLFVIDIKVSAHGLPTIGGLACLILGGLLLYNGSAVRVSRPLLISISVVIAALFAVIVRAGLRARNAPVVTGVQRLVGIEGRTLGELHPIGEVRVRGETWAARLAGDPSGSVPAGAPVRVVAIQGLTLVVEPAAS